MGMIGSRAIAPITAVGTDFLNKLGRFDAVIHNAGLSYRERWVEMEPGVPSVSAVNVLAPYILTALIERPKRLVYLRFRHASRRTSANGRSALDPAILEWLVSLRGE